MIKRLIWFVIGAAVGILVIKKIRDYLRRASPEAIGRRLSSQAGGLSESAAGFVDRARAAMAEREAELRDALGRPQDETDHIEG